MKITHKEAHFSFSNYCVWSEKHGLDCKGNTDSSLVENRNPFLNYSIVMHDWQGMYVQLSLSDRECIEFHHIHRSYRRISCISSGWAKLLVVTLPHSCLGRKKGSANAQRHDGIWTIKKVYASYHMNEMVNTASSSILFQTHLSKIGAVSRLQTWKLNTYFIVVSQISLYVCTLEKGLPRRKCILLQQSSPGILRLERWDDAAHSVVSQNDHQ